MSIQQNINQTISLTGFLFSQSPAYAQLNKYTDLKKSVNFLEKVSQSEKLPQEAFEKSVGEATEKAREYAMTGGKEGLAIYEEFSELQGKIDKDKALKAEPKESVEDVANRLREKYQMADIRLASEVEAMRESNRRANPAIATRVPKPAVAHKIRKEDTNG